MESGAKGCEVVVSGKLRAARAKSMKFTDGFMIHSGQPVPTPPINSPNHPFLLDTLNVYRIRSVILWIRRLVTFSFVKASSASR